MITNLLNSNSDPQDTNNNGKGSTTGATNNELGETATEQGNSMSLSEEETDKNFLANNKSTNLALDKLGLQGKSIDLKNNVVNWWRQTGLRRKATIIALALGIIPVAVVGGIAYQVASRSLEQQIFTEQETRTFDIRQKVTFFLNHVVEDAQALASSAILTDPDLRRDTNTQQKINLLNSFIDSHPGRYESIAVIDVQGNLLFQSKSAYPLDEDKDYSEQELFQRAIATQDAAINNPRISSSSGRQNLEVAVPITAMGTEEIIGVVTIHMPISNLELIFQYVKAQGWEYKLIDSEGRIFDSDETEQIGHFAGADLTDLPELMAKVQGLGDKIDEYQYFQQGNLGLSQIMFDRNDRDQVIVGYAPIINIKGLVEPGWGLAISRSLDEAFIPLQELRWTLFVGTTAAAVLVAVIAAILANQGTRPITIAAEAVKKIGQGELDTRVEIEGNDEFALLGDNINKMARQLKFLVQHKAIEAKRSQQLKDVTLKLSRAFGYEEILQIAVREIIAALKVDRAIFYSLKNTGNDKIVAEAVANNWPSLKKAGVTHFDFIQEYIQSDKLGYVWKISDTYHAGFKTNHLRQLDAFNIRASLIAPITFRDEVHSLLMIHQCDSTRQWKQAEVDFFTQIVSQVILALERTNLLEQQKAAKEGLQKRALSLLTEVEPISQGDLTVRATVTEDEIGTLADSYNSTVESLRKIVLQVQKVVTQMAVTTDRNEAVTQEMSQRAAEKSQEVVAALGQIQAMAESIQAVALSAEEAEKTFQETARTVALGDSAMNRTVEGIVAIRSTVAETAKKVKRLGESSQKISKVVNLISSFASQTNLLALNASLEASRAGEEGHNFAIVAEEVRVLAQQSAEATNEIEKLVASIQLDTREVVAAMEEGTERVVIGTQLVDETRQSLNKIAATSDRVSTLLEKIAQATEAQTETSQAVTETMTKIAEMANQTAVDADQVSGSTQELQTVSEELQKSVRRFKVE
ncbi:MAG: methyl-accepting chemotaxis protein [Xenococcaceae cyanobacterium]